MDLLTIVVLLTGLLIFLLLGIPVGFALGLAGIASILTVGPSFLVQIPLTISKSFSDIVLIAIPLFILMGEILYQGKVGRQLFDMASAWLCKLRGSTGMSAVFAYTFFAAIVGSSMASVLTIGKIAIPQMEKEGYSKRLVYGLSAVGGSLGILIPPSIPLIIYASLTDVSPGRLFIAGILPGLFIALLIAVWSFWSAPKRLKSVHFDLSYAIRVSLQSLPDLLLPFIILGGIYAGVYTPTEAAAIGVVYSLLLTVVWRKTISISALPHVLAEAVRKNAMLLTIVMGAQIFGSALTLIGLPQMLAEATEAANLQQWQIMLLFASIWLIMGCFLEVISIILITVPVFFPIAHNAGIDSIWFGIFMVINMEMSVMTPPVGMNLFAIKSIVPHEPLGVITRSAVPSLLVIVLGMIALWAMPEMALMLTRY